MLVNLLNAMTVQFGSLKKFGQRMSVRIAESLYSEGSAPISGSASAYVRSGLVSNSMSGSKSTISPIKLN
jgi:hypothetical protein